MAKTLTTVRAVTSRRLSGVELPECWAVTSITAAANGKGSPADLRRYERKARIVAALLEQGEAAGNNTLLGQELLLRAGRESDRP